MTATLAYTKNQAAEAMSVSLDTIERMINDGTLLAYRFGKRSIRIKPEDLDAAMRPIPSTGAIKAGLV